MKTFVALMLSSAGFGVIIAVVYWFVAHGAAGTVLLGLMGAALVFTAGYALIAERQADLEGDDGHATFDTTRGEDIGIFTPHSAYPVLVAVCAAAFLFGIVWSPLVAAAAGAGFALCLWRMGAESARTVSEE